MNNAKTIFRLLLGLIVLVLGSNKLLLFLPTPPMEGAAGEFTEALVNNGYLFETVAVVEIITGILLLINKFLPLALVILFPVLLKRIFISTIFRYWRYWSCNICNSNERLSILYKQRILQPITKSITTTKPERVSN